MSHITASEGQPLPRASPFVENVQVKIEKTSGKVPPSYVNSSVVYAQNKLFLFGGFDRFDGEMDIYGRWKVLDLETLKWSARKGLKMELLPRHGHSAELIPGTSTIVVYGGYVEEEFYSPEVYYYHIDKNEWELAAEDGLGRSRHGCCMVPDGSGMLVCGGMISGDRISREISLFRFSDRTWQTVGFLAAERYDHKMTVVGDRLWIFGGFSGVDKTLAREAHWFDLSTKMQGTAFVEEDLNNGKSEVNRAGSTHLYGTEIGGFMLDVFMNNSSGLLQDTDPQRLEETENEDEDMEPEAVPNGYSTGLQQKQSEDVLPKPSISVLDLSPHTLDRRILLDNCEEYLSSLYYKWPYMVVKDQSQLILVGHSEDADVDDKLSHILTLDMSEYGYVDPNPATIETGLGGTLGSDLFEFYKRGEMCDFEITADSDTPHDPIRVHMIVLMARWPHFKKMIDSGMCESHTKRLRIPDPFRWVDCLIEFIYRDTIPSSADLDQITGLLIMANMYDLPRLRKLCIERVAQVDMDPETAVFIYNRAKMAQSSILARNMTRYIFRNWGRIVRTEAFRTLLHHDLLSLCQEASKSAVVRELN